MLTRILPLNDILNVVLFGQRAKKWREKNLDKDGNIRTYRLNEMAIRQMKVLITAPALKQLKE